MNFGTIGTSWITESFIKAAKDVADVKLTAVYSRSETKATQLVDTYGASTVFTDVEDMAASDNLDFVYIASPNALHYEQVIPFLQQKKHVICEKPIFANTTEFEKAFQVAEANGVFLVEAMRNVHMPNLAALREEMEKARPLRQVVLNFSKYSSRYDAVLNGEEPNVFSPAFAGGTLVDLGVYPIAAAIYLFGKPQHVSYTPSIIQTGVDGSGTLVLTYPDFICTIFCSKISTSYNPSEIQGEQGTFTIDDIGSIANVNFTDIRSGRQERIGGDNKEKDMYYEIAEITHMIQENDQVKYQELTKLSRSILEITQAARKENNIIFG